MESISMRLSQVEQTPLCLGPTPPERKGRNRQGGREGSHYRDMQMVVYNLLLFLKDTTATVACTSLGYILGEELME